MFNLNKNNMPYKNYEQQSDNTRVQPLKLPKIVGKKRPSISTTYIDPSPSHEGTPLYKIQQRQSRNRYEFAQKKQKEAENTAIGLQTLGNLMGVVSPSYWYNTINPEAEPNMLRDIAIDASAIATVPLTKLSTSVLKNYAKGVASNYSKLGRYTLDNLNPRSYSMRNAGLSLLKIYTEPLFKKPPTFFNNRKPKWFKGGIPDEMRFQNGAIWAGIPEEEVPITLIKKNADGVTYRPTREAIEGNMYGTAGADVIGLREQNTINKGKIKDIDSFSTIGGEHSDYNVLYESPTAVLWQQVDEQKLNPQWLITDPIKNQFSANTKIHKFLNNLGGKNISNWLGYKPFTYKLGIGVTKDGIYPKGTFYFDPTSSSIIPE